MKDTLFYTEYCETDNEFFYTTELLALTHFKSMFHIYIPCEHKKSPGFLMFSGGMEMEHWLEIG